MIIYSDVLKKKFDSVEACLDAEKAYKEEQEIRAAEREKARAQAIEFVNSAVAKQKEVVEAVKNAVDIITSLKDEPGKLEIKVDERDEEIVRIVFGLIRSELVKRNA